MIQIINKLDGNIYIVVNKNTSMKDWASFIIPSILGLVAGIGHGVVSHHQDLPFSLSEQVIESISGKDFNQI